MKMETVATCDPTRLPPPTRTTCSYLPRASKTARTGRPACGTRRERAGQYPRRPRSTCTRNPEVSPSRNRRGRPARFRNCATFVNAAVRPQEGGGARNRDVGCVYHLSGSTGSSWMTTLTRDTHNRASFLTKPQIAPSPQSPPRLHVPTFKERALEADHHEAPA